ncbi:MAG: hypothetical protein QOE72_1480 [Chloroflexota bacterium]|jgi:uncharacterized protein (DUF1330 family)|nr:hypothetical protein [Chloroflexota bacterium]
MTVYMISQVEVLDAEAWQRYREIAAPAIARHGGEYVVRGATPEVVEGDWAPPNPERQQIIVVAFPTMEALHGWYRSADYAPALAIRRTAVRRRMVVVRGVDEHEAT